MIKEPFRQLTFLRLSAKFFGCFTANGEAYCGPPYINGNERQKYRKPDNTFAMTCSFFALKHGELQKYLFTERKKRLSIR